MAMFPDKIQLKISDVTGDGVGVGRMEGRVVFIPGALPGETVTAGLTKQKKNYIQGELLRVEVSSPLRQASMCSRLSQCGGCTWQHCTYQAELDYKWNQVRQNLRRIGGVEMEPAAVWKSDSCTAYRDRVVWHVSHQDGLKLGFYRKRSHDVCACDCQLLREPLCRMYQSLQRLLSAFAPNLTSLREVALRRNDVGETQLVFVTQQPNPEWEGLLSALSQLEPAPISVWENSGLPVYGVYGAKWRHLAGQELLPDQVLGKKLLVAPGSFQQVNRQQAERLYTLVLDWVQPIGGRVLDLYAGLGVIGLLMADQARQVISVESFAPAAAAARRNAELNHADLQVVCAPAEQALPELAAAGKIDGAVLDPPRAGCDSVLLTALAAAAPRRIVYVSCDPATLARDLRQLLTVGYQVKAIQPIDLFSRTAHVETVVLLETDATTSC